MYTRNNISQQNYYSSRPAIHLKHFKNEFNAKTINVYIDSLKGDGKVIAQFFMKFRAYGSTELKNQTIADAVGCCTRTVRRWTKKFSQDGFLMKVQKDTYSVNEYRLGVDKSTSISYWSNQNKDKAQLFNDHGIATKADGSISFQFGTPVLPYYSYINKRNPYTLEREKRYGLFVKREQKKRVVEAMLQEEQRKWIIAHKKEPALKSLLSKEPLQSQLFTSDILDIARLLELNEREKLKLTAFHERAIKDLLSVIRSFFESGKSVDIKDRVGFALGRLVKFSKSHNLTVEWPWYFALCDIFGIQALKDGESPRPIKISGINQGVPYQDRTSDEYRRKKEVKVDPFFTRSKEEEIIYLENQIEHCKLVLSDPKKYFAYEIDISIKTYNNDILLYEQKLKQLRDETA